MTSPHSHSDIQPTVRPAPQEWAQIHIPFLPKKPEILFFHKMQRFNNTQVLDCSTLLNSNTQSFFPFPFSLSKELIIPRSHSKPIPSMEHVFLCLEGGVSVKKKHSGLFFPSCVVAESGKLSRLSFPKMDRIILKPLQYWIPNDSVLHLHSIVGCSQRSSGPAVLQTTFFGTFLGVLLSVVLKHP